MNTPPVILPSVKLKRRAALGSILALLIVVACLYLNFNPIMFFTEFHFVRDLLGEMFPPNYALLWESTSFGFSILQTLAMAFLGTLYGGVAAFVLAFFAAKNIMPVAIVRVITKLLLTIIRIVPSLVVILVFVIAVGPGTFAGVLSLTLVTIGTFGKLFTEALENMDNSSSEAVYSVGADRLQVIRFSVLPQIIPTFISNLLYSFDFNLRLAIGLGIFGGGGIGFKLYLALQVLHYKDATALITCIIILVMAVEYVSNFLRGRLLGDGKL